MKKNRSAPPGAAAHHALENAAATLNHGLLLTHDHRGSAIASAGVLDRHPA